MRPSLRQLLPSCSRPWPSAASGSQWPECFAPRSTSRRRTGLYLLLLLVSGMLAPLSKLPGWLAATSQVLPAAALADSLHRALSAGQAVTALVVVGARVLGGRRAGSRRRDVPMGVSRPDDSERADGSDRVSDRLTYVAVIGSGGAKDDSDTALTGSELADSQSSKDWQNRWAARSPTPVRFSCAADSEA